MDRNDHVVELAPSVVADEVAETRIDFRMADVAVRLGISERTLARYFGGRDGLVREVASIRDAAYVRRLAGATGGPADVLATAMEASRSDTSHVPLMRLAEQVEAGSPAAVDRARRVGYTDVSDTLARTVSGLSSDHLALGLIALTVFPLAFPRWSETITGSDPRSDEFRTAHDGFLVEACARLSGASGVSGEGAALTALAVPAALSPSSSSGLQVDLDDRDIDLTNVHTTAELPLSRAAATVIEHAKGIAELAGASELAPAHLFKALRALAPGLVDRSMTATVDLD